VKSLLLANFQAKTFFFLFGAVYNLLMDILLARLLTPLMFGQFAFITSLVQGFERLKSFQLEVGATTHSGDDDRIFANYLFLALILEGLFLTVLGGYLFFSDDDDRLLPLLALKVAISTAGTFVSFLRCRTSKHLQMHRILYLLSIFKYFTGAFTLLLAWLAPGTYVLLLNELVFLLIQGILFLKVFRYPIRLGFHKKTASHLFKGGLFLWAVEWAPYLSVALVYLYVNLNFSTEEAGLMSRSVLLLSMPVIYILYNFNSIMFNAVSKMEREAADSRRFIRVYNDLFLIGVMVLAFLFLLNREWIVPLLWGDQWIRATGMAASMFPLVVAMPVHALANDLFLAMRASRRVIVLTRYAQPLGLWSFFYLFTDRNLEGLLLAFGLGYLASGLVQLLFLHRYLGNMMTPVTVAFLALLPAAWMAADRPPPEILTILGVSIAMGSAYLTYLFYRGYRPSDLNAVLRARKS
jgi:hypothetical protein